MVYGMFPLELHRISPCRVEAEFPPKPAPAAPEAESPRVKTQLRCSGAPQLGAKTGGCSGQRNKDST